MIFNLCVFFISAAPDKDCCYQRGNKQYRNDFFISKTPFAVCFLCNFIISAAKQNSKYLYKIFSYA